MKQCLIILSWSITLVASGSFQDFDWAQETLTRGEVEKRLDLYLQKDGQVGHFLKVENTALLLYDAPETDPNRSVEFSLKFAQSKKVTCPRRQKRHNLIGAKIALDPGHLGGPYARLEERYIDIPESIGRSRAVLFDEGSLSFLTAAYLKILLEKEGAIVMLTRSGIGQGGYKEGFFDWINHSPHLWDATITLGELFKRFYNPLDLRARAEKINAFSPHLTVILHYNAHQDRPEHSSNRCVSSRNYNLAFIPGGFCRDELAAEDSRYEFMRLLVTDDLEESTRLSSCILDALSKKLKVPVLAAEDGASYLKRIALKIQPGIYARNLALTRLVHGPVCYGESLIQNNIDECLNLSQKDFIIEGIPCSWRIKEVAEAYFEGIQEYLLK